MPKSTGAAQSPNRQHHRKLTAMGNLASELLEVVSPRILARLRIIRRRTQGGAYLLVDSAGYVYVLPDDSISSKEWITKFPKLLVGRYGVHGMPLVQQLIADLVEHLTTMPKL